MMSTAPINYPYALGVQYFEEKGKRGLKVAFSSKTDDCGIILYDRNTDEEIGRYPFSPEHKVGNVYYQTITGIEPQKISYLFYEGKTSVGEKILLNQSEGERLIKDKSKYVKLIADKSAKAFADKDTFGEAKGAEDYKAIIVKDTYDWGNDRLPQVAHEDCIAYCMHVRGFTVHSSSGVKAKGTFKGIIEKIPYLKELGITTLELQPAYEFNEVPKVGISEKSDKNAQASPKKEEPKLNYWGYKEGFYYTPKRSYAKGTDANKEFKDMVKTLHENGMEVVMQFYFPNSVVSLEVLDILRFWRIQYHVDGFHLKGDNLPIKEIAKDPYLADCKLWYYDFPVDEIYANRKPAYRNLAFYNDTYMRGVRRLLKGDEGTLYEAVKFMRVNPSTHGVINYLTNYEGFTMADLFSYERKHNEENGENNKDGQDYNYSSNCGAEGETLKKSVLVLRKKQMKNAFTFLMLSQGTPLFFMGDEFGNSQKGNNNPYCQDNEVSWLNWRDLKKNTELFEYVKQLITFRKEHRLFHMFKEYLLMDYKACGYPDLSFHGSEAWKPVWEPYSRHAGFMICGEYLEECKDSFYYVAINMHGVDHRFALPNLPKGMKWKSILTTGLDEVTMIENTTTEGDKQRQTVKKSLGDVYLIKQKTIAVFCGEK